MSEEIFTEEKIIEIVDNMMREEFLGYHPGIDNPIKFKAKVEDHYIHVFAVGKWRPLLEYYPNRKIPSQKIQQRVIGWILLDCGFKAAQTIKSKWHVNRDNEMIPVELDWS